MNKNAGLQDDTTNLFCISISQKHCYAIFDDDFDLHGMYHVHQWAECNYKFPFHQSYKHCRTHITMCNVVASST